MRKFIESQNLLQTLESEYKTASSDVDKLSALQKIVHTFPFLYGYWLKLIQSSQDPATEWLHALKICQCIELWKAFLNSDFGSDLKSAQTGVESIGFHFYSHPVYDAVLARSNADTHNSAEIPESLLKIPLFEFAKYSKRALERNSDKELVNTLNSKTKQDVATFWKFESQIKRHYFHTLQVPQQELDAWLAYLNSVETSKEYPLVKCLYDRCILVTALYPQFWLRYLKFLFKNSATQSEVTQVVQNAIAYNKVFYSDLEREVIRYCGYYMEHLQNLELARTCFQLLGSEVILFDLRVGYVIPSPDVEYDLMYTETTGDVTRVDLEQLSKKQAKRLFESENIDPITLMPLFKKGLCPDPIKYCGRLKSFGYLKEFFNIDSGLHVAPMP